MNDIWGAFRDAQKAKQLIDSIHKAAAHINHTIKLMEVCGTHTQAIFRFGIRSLLPKNLDIISGPGCPVCVTPNHFLDTLIEYSKHKDAIIVVFGDLLKIPGSDSSLLNQRSQGCDVRIVYSPLEALEIAEKEKNKNVIFAGIGFETTAPAIAAAIVEADIKKINNFYVLSAIKVLPPPLTALLSSKDVSIDGLILPGHVSAIIGLKAYKFLIEDFSMPGVIAGFEPIDILGAVLRLVQMITEGKPAIENIYSRVVKENGNEKALSLLYDVFEEADSEWRGIGIIKDSGLQLKNKFSHRDPLQHIEVKVAPPKENPHCLCGEVLKGVKKPFQCQLFKKVCTPENPIGSCMVSYEGTCAAYFKYYDENILNTF